jgi:molecular chaperone GrpE
MTEPRKEQQEEQLEEQQEELRTDPGASASGESAPVSAEPTAEERLQAERDEFEAKWLRVVAELDNVRKRTRRDMGDARRFARAEVLRRFLEVLDNFDRALQSSRGDEGDGGNDGFREGVELIFQNFRGVLKDLGVEPIEALDREFDPNVHEAVGTLPREGVESGHVIEVVAEGYMFDDMVLRPARVIISS